MFIQIHMLQSMPPGNLNRDEVGQPKKCVFGGVTRGRISSQCLKRHIRLSSQFKEAFGDALANRTQYLPQMVVDQLKANDLGVPANELDGLMPALAARFRKGDRGNGSEEVEKDDQEVSGASSEPAEARDGAGKTPQLVYFPPPFAQRIAELTADFRRQNDQAYGRFIGRKKEGKKLSKAEKEALDGEIKEFVKRVFDASKTLTVDIGLFGRMTTSDLIVNVEATCQVAHAIGTHETLTESDYFTAMDDCKDDFMSAQTDRAGAAYLGSGADETFFNAAVYYKYLNIDTDALRDEKHLPTLTVGKAARVAGVLISAAALANPTGKQNSFAAHSIPELILVEISKTKRPISYANAFLQPVEGGAARNLMTESATALGEYFDSVATAFAPTDVQCVLLAVGPASIKPKRPHDAVATLDGLVETVVKRLEGAA